MFLIPLIPVFFYLQILRNTTNNEIMERCLQMFLQVFGVYDEKGTSLLLLKHTLNNHWPSAGF